MMMLRGSTRASEGVHRMKTTYTTTQYNNRDSIKCNMHASLFLSPASVPTAAFVVEAESPKKPIGFHPSNIAYYHR